MASQPEVTVIIPNYNGKKLLENCIQTLERQTCTDFKLLVVDNGSDDGSTEVTSSLDLTMLALKENTGFCGAVNEGIRRADTPYVILLNNDTEFCRNSWRSCWLRSKNRTASFLRGQ